MRNQTRTDGGRTAVKRRGSRPAAAVLLWLAGATLAGPPDAAGEPEPGPPAIRFENLTNVDGLSQVSAFAITQDRLGFLWIGTEDGLNRYDGTGFRVLRHRAGDPAASQLPGAIQALHADRAGNLWIGMRTGGFSRYDPAAERFTHFLQGDGEPDPLSQFEVSAIHQTADGGVWVGLRGGGLVRVEPGSDELTLFRHDPADAGSLGHDTVEAFAEGPDGLWIGTDGGGLDRFDASTGRFDHFRADAGDPAADRVKALYAAPSGLLWIGTDGAGLYRFERAAGRFTPAAAGDRPGDRFLWVVQGDRSGVLWLGTRRDGLLRYDPAAERVDPYRHDPDVPGTLSSNDVRSIFEDRAGNVWIGTWTHGADRFHPDDGPFLNYRHVPSDPESLSAGIVMALHEDPAGDLWVGTTGGLNRRQADGGFVRYPADPADANRLADDVVLALEIDGDGDLWVGTPGILHRFDPSRQRFARFVFDPEASGSQAGTASMALQADGAGKLWIGSYRGLTRFDPATGGSTSYRHDPGDPRSLSHDYVTSIASDRTGALWVGTLGGLNRLYPERGGFERHLADPDDPASLRTDQILHVYVDRSGVLWAGTFGGGLHRFDAATGGFTAYTEADGLPNDVVWKILEDDLGRLWMSTTRGLARFDPEARRFTAYDPADGILDFEFNLGAGCRGAGGWMYFGGVRGVDAFRSGRFRDNLVPPPVVLTSFKVFQEDAELPVAPPYLEEIELSHRENFFSFEFAALNFRRPDKNRYLYRLEGLDQDWVDGGTRPLAIYTKVAPGDYVFRVRASNNDGVWTEEGASVRIRVRPPFWATWWAYALYALAAVAALGGWVNLQRRKIAREQALVRRLREVDRLKDEFLANTSHELRTPLHGIMGLAESLIDGVRGELAPEARRDLSMIVASSRRLAGLVDDILDFSRLRHGVLELEKRPVDVRSLADVVLALSRPLARDRRLELLNAVPEELPAAAGDEDRLQQILHNLVGNAIKFTDEGSVEVGASATGDEIVVRVTDTGIGIEEEARERIFDAFEQADASAGRVYGGTGLGLAVSRQLVELHGGRMWLESEPGKGSTFFFSLPVFRGAGDAAEGDAAAPGALLEPALEEAAAGAAAELQAATGGGGERLLIVDDEPIIRQVLVNHLSLGNYRLETAASGREALEWLEKKAFDLVLLDVMMPKMSGYEVCARIRERHSVQELPVLFLTAKTQVANRVSGFAAGANDYLSKPISKHELLARVRSHLELLRLHRNLETLLAERTHELEQRKQLAAELERLLTEVEYIHYTVSHDLKNPLVTIKNFIGKVKQSAALGDSANLDDGLQRIDLAADHMRWLLEGLIRYSRIGQEVHEPEEVDLSALAQAARDRLAGPFEEHDFEIEVAPDLPRVAGDPALLIVVFQSLFDNAVKFAGEIEAPRLEVGWRRDGEVVIEVRDNGPGIPPEYHDRIFRLFERLDPERSGTGVGLALVRRIIEAHGGRVWVESDGAGKGSTFCFTLPDAS